MRTIAAVTVGRSDYGIYRSLLRRLAASPEIRLQIIASGMHLVPEFGNTVAMIEEDGFEISDRVESVLASDRPDGIAKSMGLGVVGFSQVFARRRPDLLIVLGDRFDMFPAALAALPFGIPVAHVHGGEVSHGAIDDALRHSMTKLSHLHFVSTEEYRRRVIQMGEEPWRVTVSGAPALDQLEKMPLLSAEELETRFGVKLTPAPLLVTFHPVTLESGQAAAQIGDLLGALEDADQPVVFTAPNADADGRLIRRAIEDFVARHSRAWLVENFGQQAYFSMLKICSAMVGNSSSGLIEALSFHLPAVNVGNRQAGRVRGANVIDVPCVRADIAAGVKKALSQAFRSTLRQAPNPYRISGNDAAAVIAERLETVPLDSHLIAKEFHDVPFE